MKVFWQWQIYQNAYNCNQPVNGKWWYFYTGNHWHVHGTLFSNSVCICDIVALLRFHENINADWFSNNKKLSYLHMYMYICYTTSISIKIGGFFLLVFWNKYKMHCNKYIEILCIIMGGHLSFDTFWTNFVWVGWERY